MHSGSLAEAGIALGCLGSGGVHVGIPVSIPHTGG